MPSIYALLHAVLSGELVPGRGLFVVEPGSSQSRDPTRGFELQKEDGDGHGGGFGMWSCYMALM